jgi:hypothetical protein
MWSRRGSVQLLHRISGGLIRAISHPVDEHATANQECLGVENEQMSLQGHTLDIQSHHEQRECTNFVQIASKSCVKIRTTCVHVYRVCDQSALTNGNRQYPSIKYDVWPEDL